jgi:hypothetical protein
MVKYGKSLAVFKTFYSRVNDWLEVLVVFDRIHEIIKIGTAKTFLDK